METVTDTLMYKQTNLFILGINEHIQPSACVRSNMCVHIFSRASNRILGTTTAWIT